MRPGLRGTASLALITAVSLIRGAYLLNSRAGTVIGIAAEVALLAFVITRAKRLETILPSKTLVRIARAEIDVYRFAFGRTKPVNENAKAFTIHESSGAAILFWMLALLTPLEAAGMHFILPVKLAWLFTALSVYGAVWMIAVARSFAALPILVDAQGIHLRRGMMASLYVPRDAIDSVQRTAAASNYARFAVLSDAAIFITFNRPLTLRLPLGFTRQVPGASLAPDDVPGFLSALSGN